MKQRPIACLALFVFLILSVIPAGFFYEPRQVADKCEAQITGRVGRYTEKEDGMQLELQNCEVRTGQTDFREDTLLIYLDGTEVYPPGTSLSLSGTLYPTEEPTNPGQFDARLYYRGQGISYTVFAEKVSVIETKALPVQTCLLSVKSRIGSVYRAVLSERDSGLVSAMVLGDKQGLDTEVKEFYQKNGISHLLAISGLHVSLIGMGTYRMLKRLCGSCIMAGIPTFLFLCAYGWMTGGSVSALRAVLMCSLSVLADMAGRTYDMLTAIGAAALVLMATDPLNARQSAFLLSFGAVLAIALFQPLWNLYCPKMTGPGQSMSVSLSVMFLTLPFLLHFFFTYPLYSTFLNLLVIPLMSGLMICGILCGITGLFSLKAAGIFGIPCHLILEIYDRAGGVCLSLPGSVLSVGDPGSGKILLYYTAAAAAIGLLYKEKRRKKYWMKKDPFRPKKTPLVISLAAFGLCTALMCVRIRTGLEITMLDVGQGDSFVIQSPDGTTFLLDGGSTSESEVGNYRILPFLKARGIRNVDYVMISHADQDHVSGLKELAEESGVEGDVRIGCAVLPAVAEKDDNYLELEQVFQEAGIPLQYMGAGDRLLGEKVSLTCLWPERTLSLGGRNELSMVLLLEYGEFQMLFTGDIGEYAERRIIRTEALRDVEILKVAHHGSRYSSCDEFLQYIRPEAGLISCSASNTYGHPGEETLHRLADAGCRVFITKDSGAVRIWTDGRTVRIRNYINTRRTDP